MKIIEGLEQNTELWLNFRRSRLGASDANIVMNASPFCTCYQLWERKLGLAEEQKENAYMTRGKDLEKYARQEFYSYTGYEVHPIVGLHDKIPYMMASFDGYSIEHDIAVEIKCPSNIADHELALKGEIPKKYHYQLQHQMEVAGLDVIYYCSYMPQATSPFALVEVERQADMIEKMLDAEEEFYNCMKNFIEPKKTESEEYCINTNSSFGDKVKAWQEIKSQKDMYVGLEEKYRREIIEACGNVSTHGFGVKVKKIIQKGSVDYNDIPELKGVDLEKYRKHNIVKWTIRED